MNILANKKIMLKALGKVREKVCVYKGDICDCKYWIHQQKDTRSHGEVSGCPEMRTVIAVVENMTDFEYNRIIKRMKKQGHNLLD